MNQERSMNLFKPGMQDHLTSNEKVNTYQPITLETHLLAGHQEVAHLEEALDLIKPLEKALARLQSDQGKEVQERLGKQEPHILSMELTLYLFSPEARQMYLDYIRWHKNNTHQTTNKAMKSPIAS